LIRTHTVFFLNGIGCGFNVLVTHRNMSQVQKMSHISEIHPMQIKGERPWLTAQTNLILSSGRSK